MTPRADAIAVARALGAAAFARGALCVPAQDPAVVPLLRLANPAGTPGPAIGLLDAWLVGWHAANVAESIEAIA